MAAVRNVYLDCEFLPAVPTLDGLVSIALTDDEGRDYYAVNYDMDADAVCAVPWMVANVWPYLPLSVDGGLLYGHPDVKRPLVIRDQVADYFADTDADTTHLYAYYGGQDICRLHSLWDNNWAAMPKQVPTWFFDLKALAVQAGKPELPKMAGGEHHALADARHNRAVHQFLLSLTAPGAEVVVTTPAASGPSPTPPERNTHP